MKEKMYCPKCKMIREVEDAEEVEHEGQKILKAKCSVCKSKMFKMLGKKS
jgi:hypothetical protein